ncbi:Smr/MutS family protein [Qipengyuania nanhaisediminis]|uniref:DNA-nicking endonuclease, Smr domain n=1 Tax=Qipengyuania nanhaisediminis TaxID=604088 RepID=A0A1I5L8R5_9SPHN|nr:Smr/MutS family protein [Qipengyuania nanhaisediminis]SFO93552.1 DNA-nicking endonuclease, Smr domain [Qipengyuania nanhaisediminis]
MSAPRGLSAQEAEAWEKVAATVEPLHPRAPVRKLDAPIAPKVTVPKPSPRKPAPLPAPRPGAAPIKSANSLDSHWDRRLKSGAIQPDFTLDLHDHGLDAAYNRLISGVAQARSMGARTILLITGKPRPVDPADRGHRRGAIRAKVLDWLAASSHHSAIAAVRRAHQRHGGDGALYIVLRRER